MAKIVYMEDSESVRDIVEYKLKAEFPEYELVLAESVRKGFNGAFGTELQVSDCSCVDSVVEKLAGTDFSDIAMVVTDGKLYENLNGWDGAAILRKLGYEGPLAYSGASKLPEGTISNFDVCLNSFMVWEDMISYGRQVLK